MVKVGSDDVGMELLGLLKWGRVELECRVMFLNGEEGRSELGCG